MSFYFPDGNGGRRIIETGSGETTSSPTPSQQGAMIFCGTIGSSEILNQVSATEGRTGDMWLLTFDDADANVYDGDMLLNSGNEWRIVNLAERHFNYTLPTASQTVKGGVVVGNGLSMNGAVLNVSLPTASVNQKGGIKVGHGLAMSGDTLHVTLRGGTSSGAQTKTYGQIVSVPQEQSSLPADLSALSDWQVVNTATYHEQSSGSGYWEGDVYIALPSPFLIGNYNITHIHNAADYSAICSKDDLIVTGTPENGYEIVTLDSRPFLKIPAITIAWQSDSLTQLVIHGEYESESEHGYCFVPGEGLELVNGILNVTAIGSGSGSGTCECTFTEEVKAQIVEEITARVVNNIKEAVRDATSGETYTYGT